MGDLLDQGAALEESFEVHGVRAVLSASDRDLLEAAMELLPPEATRDVRGDVKDHFALLREAGGEYRVVSPYEGVQMCRDRELALGLLEAELHLHVAEKAPNRIAIHAGVAVYRGRAIVIPGPPLSGKTTLVTELVRAGALYFSDEYAFLDGNGLVHPFPRPLRVRRESGEDANLLVERLGGVKGTDPVPIGLIAVTWYRPGARWEPARRSRAQGMLALLSNTLPARDRPAQAMAVTRRAAEPALVLEGARGEAGVAAAALLEAMGELPL